MIVSNNKLDNIFGQTVSFICMFKIEIESIVECVNLNNDNDNNKLSNLIISRNTYNGQILRRNAI